MRAATIDDAAAIERLAAEFHAYLRNLGDQESFDFTAQEYIRDGFGADPAFHGLVAEKDGAVIGYLLYNFGYDSDRGRRLIYVLDLYVQAVSRGNGIGKALMSRLGEIGRAHSIEAMWWAVYKPNSGALQFYEKIGARYMTDLHFMFINI